ncbi:KTSC domain-containing protein [Roseibium alexandrii]|uniref:KTSC domain-containing protein n=1 Tax=Roseibium alexandrii (strain DSM 17067 / NCIMB 14079 / DFL-11) TaxID=244592 RepID=A0A5E8UXG4_ROSAD|nr:KTSC domain-containing protein [Roseibium alexandrii]RMX61914.1 hypothetical protein SADFL11_00000700 [Roseibium alexandrii DFL-11]
MTRYAIILIALLGFTSLAQSETVYVKYRGDILLDTFSCQSISRSSFVKRVCYQPETRYMILRLRSTYYHYCEVGSNVVTAFLGASSMGRFYNVNIRASSNGGLYDCRNHRVPSF